MNWALYFLILSWLTLGIYPIMVLYQRIARRDAHFQRIDSLFRALITTTREAAQQHNVDVEYALLDIESRLREAEGAYSSKKIQCSDSS